MTAGAYGTLSLNNSAHLLDHTYKDSKIFKDFIQNVPLPKELRAEIVELAVAKNFYNSKLPTMRLIVKNNSLQLMINEHKLNIRKGDRSVEINDQALKIEKIKNFENLYEQIEKQLKKTKREAFNNFYDLWINPAHAELIIGSILALAALFSIFIVTLDSLSNHGLLEFVKQRSGLFSPAEILVEKEFLQIKCEKQIVAGKEKFFPSEIKVTVKCKDKTDCAVKNTKFFYRDGQLASMKDEPCLIQRGTDGVFRIKPIENGSQECEMAELSERAFNKNIYPLKTLEFQCEKYPETEVFRTVFPISGVDKIRENLENEKVRVSKITLKKTEPESATSGK